MRTPLEPVGSSPSRTSSGAGSSKKRRSLSRRLWSFTAGCSERLAYTIVHNDEEMAYGCAPLVPKFVEWIGAAGLVPQPGDPRC